MPDPPILSEDELARRVRLFKSQLSTIARWQGNVRTLTEQVQTLQQRIDALSPAGTSTSAPTPSGGSGAPTGGGGGGGGGPVFPPPPPNQAPVIQHVDHVTLTRPYPLILSPIVSDDGLPVGSSLTYAWSQASPESPQVSFSSTTTRETTVTATGTDGDTVLELRVSDGDKSTSKLITVTIRSNQAPTVSFTDQGIGDGIYAVVLPNTLPLSVTVTDDGYPLPTKLTTTWSKLGGPVGSMVLFSDVQSVEPVANFTTESLVTRTFTGGTADAVVVGTGNGLDNLAQGPMTIAVWMYCSLIDGVYRRILCKDTDSLPGEGWLLAIVNNGSAVLDFEARFSTTAGEWTCPAPSLNAWHRVVVTYNGASVTNDPSFWIDDVLQVTTEVVTPVGTAVADSTRPLVIGNRSVTRNRAFHGQLAYAQVWNVIINPNQVVSAVTNPGTYRTGLLLQTDAACAVDGSDRAQTLTLSGTTTAAIAPTSTNVGFYLLRASAFDGQYTTPVTAEVTVKAAGTANTAPTVNAGPDQTITLPSTATMAGSVSDDGHPSSTLTNTWSLVSGPGDVFFSDTHSLTAVVSFGASGVFVLRLSSFDGEFTTPDDVTITVNAAPSVGSSTYTLTLTRSLTIPYPVVTGLPFAQGALQDVANMKLTRAAVEVPMSARSRSVWPDGSLAIVEICFLAQAGDTTYTLTFGGSASRAGGANVAVPSFPGTMTILNAAGVSEAIAQTAAVTEEQNFVRAVVRYEHSVGGTGSTANVKLITYVMSYAGWTGLLLSTTLVGTQTDNASMWPWETLWPPGSGQPWVRKKSWQWAFTETLTGLNVTVGIDGGNVTAAAQTSPRWLQTMKANLNTGFPTFKNFSKTVSGTSGGTLLNGWIETTPRSLCVRHCAQQAPKAIKADSTSLTLELHPQGGGGAFSGDLFFMRPGGSKTYEVLSYPGTGASALSDLLNNPPLALPSTADLAAAGPAYGAQLVASGSSTAGYHQKLTNGLYNSVPCDDGGQGVTRALAVGGAAQLWGWFDFGDHLRETQRCANSGNDLIDFPGDDGTRYNDTHVGANAYWWEYLMTKTEGWRQWAEPKTRMYMNSIVAHTKRSNHDGGWGTNYPAGEPLVASHKEVWYHQSKKFFDTHLHLSGLTVGALLLGDRRMQAVLAEVGAWLTSVITGWSTNIYRSDLTYADGGPRHSSEAERAYAWPLYCATQLYRATGNATYHTLGSYIVKHCLKWWKWPTAYWNRGIKIRDGNWQAGTGFWPGLGTRGFSDGRSGSYWIGHENTFTNNPASTTYPSYSSTTAPTSDFTNGQSGWMSSHLVSQIILWLVDDASRNVLTAGERTDALAMCMQVINFNAKYNFAAPDKMRYTVWDSPNQNEAGTYLHSFAWYVQQYQAGVPNPTWYDMYDTVRTYVTLMRTRFALASGSFNYATWGYYGYGPVFPPEGLRITLDVT